MLFLILEGTPSSNTHNLVSEDCFPMNVVLPKLAMPLYFFSSKVLLTRRKQCPNEATKHAQINTRLLIHVLIEPSKATKHFDSGSSD